MSSEEIKEPPAILKRVFGDVSGWVETEPCLWRHVVHGLYREDSQPEPIEPELDRETSVEAAGWAEMSDTLKIAHLNAVVAAQGKALNQLFEQYSTLGTAFMALASRVDAAFPQKPASAVLLPMREILTPGGRRN